MEHASVVKLEDAPGSNPGGHDGREGSTPSARTKLFIVIRRDLEPFGLGAAQACHAMRQWTAEHPELDRRWFEESNTLVLLEVPDESALEALWARAREAQVPSARFKEPDLGDALTALTIGPSGAGLVAQLPLAMKGGL